MEGQTININYDIFSSTNILIGLSSNLKIQVDIKIRHMRILVYRNV